MKIDPPLFQPTTRTLSSAPGLEQSEARRAFAAMLTAARQPTATATTATASAMTSGNQQEPATRGRVIAETSKDGDQPILQRPGRVLDIRV